jgi:hypothetical protein
MEELHPFARFLAENHLGVPTQHKKKDVKASSVTVAPAMSTCARRNSLALRCQAPAKYFQERAARADLAAFDRLLARVGEESPYSGDAMPEK